MEVKRVVDVENKLLVRFGFVIRRRRVQLGLSQEAFADLVGLHRTYIGSVERGERNVSLVNVERIAGGLQLPGSEILKQVEAMDD